MAKRKLVRVIPLIARLLLGGLAKLSQICLDLLCLFTKGNIWLAKRLLRRGSHSSDKNVEVLPEIKEVAQTYLQSPPKNIIVDGETGEIIEENSEPTVLDEIEATALSIPSAKSEDASEESASLPVDMVRQAAKNQAYRMGLQQLKDMGLDQDELLEAASALERRYYRN